MAGGALALIASPAAAQVVKPDPTMGDAVSAPLDDLNVMQGDIPEVLQQAALDPYAHEDLENCNDIVTQIAAIDRILGADFDIAEPSENNISAGRVARTIIRSFIPFRRVIREISGAEDREREIEVAVTSGMVRRSYLKGLGQGRGCEYPARPRPDRVVREMGEDEVKNDNADEIEDDLED